jgi:hypothetical protein
MTIGTICALALAVFAVAPQISAQSSGSAAGKGGIFGSLKVGQMVEYKSDNFGAQVITTYEDEETKVLMRHKVKEIGHDYISLDFDDRNGSGASAEVRIPAARVLLGHVAKTKAKSATGTDDSLSDKPGTKPSTKPGTKKKT